MDISDIRREHLRRLCDLHGGQRQLADKTDSNPNYFSQILTGIRNLGPGVARRIERRLGLPSGSMDTPLKLGSDVESIAASLTLVPEIPWDEVGRLKVVSKKNEETRASYPSAKASASSFALRVTGDVMENHAGGRTYQDGCIIIVDPEVSALPSDRVVVRMPDQRVMFRQLVEDGGERYLKPLNPRYPVQPLPADAEIIGVVVQTIIDG